MHFIDTAIAEKGPCARDHTARHVLTHWCGTQGAGALEAAAAVYLPAVEQAAVGAVKGDGVGAAPRLGRQLVVLLALVRQLLGQLPVTCTPSYTPAYTRTSSYYVLHPDPLHRLCTYAVASPCDCHHEP